jgi:hypothetical protein
MQVHVVVGVDVVERETRFPEGIELGADLRFELTTRAGVEKDPQTHPPEPLRQAAASIDEFGDLLGGQHRRAVRDDHVKPHPQAGETPRAGDGIVRRLARHHEARGREDPPGVGLLYALVDRYRATEVVADNDEAFQAAFSRAQRKRKNS